MICKLFKEVLLSSNFFMQVSHGLIQLVEQEGIKIWDPTVKTTPSKVGIPSESSPATESVFPSGSDTPSGSITPSESARNVSRPLSRGRRLKRRRKEDPVEALLRVVIKRISGSEDKLKQKQSAMAFGEYLGLELAKLDVQSVCIIQKLCSDALFLAQMKELKATARIVNE